MGDTKENLPVVAAVRVNHVTPSVPQNMSKI
jgi:hypothetical protein